MRSLISVGLSLVFIFFASHVHAASAPTDIAYNNYATTNSSTSVYKTLIVATVRPFTDLMICDTSGHISKIAIGVAGSEVDLTASPISGCVVMHLGKLIAAGTRISFESLDAAITTGFLLVSGVQ